MGRRGTCLLLVAVIAAGGLLAPAGSPGSASLGFEPVQELQPLGSDPESVAIGDVTGDGRRDVVMSTGAYQSPRYDWKVLLYRQLPNGTLAEPEAFSPVWHVAVHGLAVGDVDGDRRNDVVVAADLGVNVFHQRSGTLSRPFFIPFTVGGYAVDIVDMNRDGREDVVVRGGTWVRIAMNLRRGFRTSIVARGRNQDVEAGDVNGDRRPDLVAASFKGRLRVYRQRRNGSFSRARVQRTRHGASSVAVGDVTRDGRMDVALVGGGFIQVLAQNAKGRLVPLSATRGVDYPAAIETFDVSGDGKVDLIARASESVGVVLQQERGAFGGFDVYLAGRPLSWHPNSIAAGDVTGDGRPDIVAAGGLARGLFLWRQLPRG
jgi:serine protease